MKFKFAKFFNVHVGPQLGFLINDDFPEQNKPKNFNFGGVIGIGAEFNSYFVQLRYSPSGIDKHDLSTNVISESNNEVRNDNFQVSIGYYLFSGIKK